MGLEELIQILSDEKNFKIRYLKLNTRATECPRSPDPVHIVNYYIKLVDLLGIQYRTGFGLSTF